MPGMSINSASSGSGNKLGTDAAIQNQKDLVDRMSLKSSADRIKKIRAQYSQGEFVLFPISLIYKREPSTPGH
ncbi:MAG: hypothetical protein HZA01_04550 [Nitrospinae bacterium]|nr:hypothetical protein [Nitrospinota bacterium]